MEEDALKRIGLSDADRKVYLKLLELGPSTATEIAKATGIYRTNIYNILDKLQDKGFASGYREGKTTHFKTTDPENLMNYVKETENGINSILPQLKKIQKKGTEKLDIQLFHGEKGMMAAYKDIINSKTNVLGFGMGGQFINKFPILAEQWVRDIKKNKIHNRWIYVEGTEIKHPNFEIRVVPKEYLTPVTTHIYGDNVMIGVWSLSLAAILIRNKNVANNYRKYFELMWHHAKKL